MLQDSSTLFRFQYAYVNVLHHSIHVFIHMLTTHFSLDNIFRYASLIVNSIWHLNDLLIVIQRARLEVMTYGLLRNPWLAFSSGKLFNNLMVSRYITSAVSNGLWMLTRVQQEDTILLMMEFSCRENQVLESFGFLV